MAKKKKRHLIEKSNLLNESLIVFDKPSKINIVEYRIWCLYLSRNNARDLSTKKVVINADDYCRIAQITHLNKETFKASIESLLKRTLWIPANYKGSKAWLATMFRPALIDEDNMIIELEIEDILVPYVFNLSANGYFSFSADLLSKLTTLPSIRLYELCKQYKKIGRREIDIDLLKAYLFIGEDEYADRLDHFKSRILNPAIKLINANSDLIISYEKGKSKEKSKAWKSIVFTIKDNPNYIDQLSFDDLQPEEDSVIYENKFAKLIKTEVFKGLFSLEQCRLIEKTVFQHFKQDDYVEIAPKAYVYLINLFSNILDRVKYGLTVLEDEKSYDESKYFFSYFLTSLKNNIAVYETVKELPLRND